MQQLVICEKSERIPMGQEAKIMFSGKDGTCGVRAHLDSQFLELSGGKKLKLPLSEVKSASIDGGELFIKTKTLQFSLRLGEVEALKWHKKILNPPSLGTKLGLKPGRSALLIGALPVEIINSAQGATSLAKIPKSISADIAIAALISGKEKDAIKFLAAALGEKSALWLIYEKGRPVNGDDIIMLARKAGLKDTKVARISETHTGLRFIRA